MSVIQSLKRRLLVSLNEKLGHASRNVHSLRSIDCYNNNNNSKDQIGVIEVWVIYDVCTSVKVIATSNNNLQYMNV